jgi:putative endonuclease
MYYFYVLQSDVDNGYYYGSTTNLKRRIAEHQKGSVAATSYRLPLKLVYYEAYETPHQARFRERQVKISGSVRLALHKRISHHPDNEGPARPPAGKPGQ